MVWLTVGKFESLSGVEERVETPQLVFRTQSPAMKEMPAPVEDPTPVTGFVQVADQDDNVEQAHRNKKRRRESNSVTNADVRDASGTVNADASELYEALRKLSEHAPHSELVVLVHNEIYLPDDFQDRDLVSQVAAIRVLAEGIKALSSAPMCCAFFTTFVVKQLTSGEPLVDTSATKIPCDPAQIVCSRLQQSERDLASYVQTIHEKEFQEWDLERKQTMNKRRQFENIRTTLESWIQSKKRRGSVLDRLMDQFERLLTNSLALWDVPKDGVIRTCVEQIATVASIVDGSIEKQAARAGKLNTFRNILSNEVPPTTRATRATNYQMRRDDASA